MRSRLLAAALLACLALLPPISAGAWEADYSNLSKTGPVTISSASPTIVLEVFGQLIGVALGNIQAQATLVGTSTTVTLTPTAVSTANTGAGVTNYFTLDASPICPGGGSWIVTTNIVGGGQTVATASRLVTCVP
jgi:hypothetical protein